MGSPFVPANDDSRLFQECEKILLGIPRRGGDIFSCALTIKQLAARLPLGCASDISVKNVRQVLSQPAHQNVLIALDDVNIVHVKKFEEQPQAAEGPAGEPDDAACNFWDAPASLEDAEQEGEKDAWRQGLMEGGEAQRGMRKERAESGAVQAATASASPRIALENMQVTKRRDPPRADLGMEKQGVATPETGRDNEPRGASAPFLSSGAVGGPSSAPAKDGFSSQTSKGDPGEHSAEGAGEVKQQETTHGAVPVVAVMNGIAGSQNATSHLDSVSPGGGRGRSGGAEASSGAGHEQEKGEEESEEEQLGKLRHCQDEIKRLLLQRHTLESALRARLTQHAQAGQAAKARQLAAQLAQIERDMPQLPGTGPEQAPPGSSAPNGVAPHPLDPGRRDANGHAASPSVGRTSGRLGGQGAEAGGESDVEMMDAPPAATEWAKKRETALKRRREGQGGDARAKRARGSETPEQEVGTGMDGQSERQKGIETKVKEEMDQSRVGQKGNRTAGQNVTNLVGGGLASRTAAPCGGGASPPVAEPASRGPPGSSGGFGEPPAATGNAGSMEQRRSDVEAASASSSRFPPALVTAAEELVGEAEVGSAALAQAEVAAELQRRGIGTADKSVVGKGLHEVRASRASVRGETSSGERSGEAQGEQLMRVPSEKPTTDDVVAVQGPAGGGAKAGAGEQDKGKTHVADTSGEAPEGGEQARAGGTSNSTGEQTPAPAARQDAADAKVVGLGFKRKRHGAAPKRRRLEPVEPVHLDWNINGEDEAGSALLESVLAEWKGSSSVAEVDRGWMETPHVAKSKTDGWLEAPTAEAIGLQKAQTRAIQHRKQKRPRRLVKSRQSISS